MPSDAFALWCGHWACKGCWAQYIEVKVKDRCQLPMQCAAFNCKAVLPSSKIQQLVTPAVLYAYK